MKWGVVILAGGYAEPDLAIALGTHRKALAEIGGSTCLARTLDAVRRAGLTEIRVVGGEETAGIAGPSCWVPEERGQMDNARAGIGSLPPVDGVLWLPADAPFLRKDGIINYLARIEERVSQPNWISAGLCPLAQCLATFPGSGSKSLRLARSRYRSGAYFATSPSSFQVASGMFEKISANRRNVIGMLAQLGPLAFAKYLSGRISLTEAEEVLGKLFGSQGIIVADCDPEMVIDIDTLSDWEFILRYADRYPVGPTPSGEVWR